MEEFFILDIVSTGHVCLKCICCFQKLEQIQLIGNRTLCRPIPSVIILMTDKSFLSNRFC